MRRPIVAAQAGHSYYFIRPPRLFVRAAHFGIDQRVTGGGAATVGGIFGLRIEPSGAVTVMQR